MKDSFYFQHDYNSANDQKILKLRAKFNNAEGYGVYFMILEAMAQQSNGKLEYDCIAELSLSYSLAINLLKNIIDYCLEVGLFFKENKFFYSNRMIEHKKFRINRMRAGKKGAKIRWENSSAIAQPKLSYSSAIAQPMQRKGKERKEKKINKKKETSNNNRSDFFLNEKSETKKNKREWDFKGKQPEWHKNCFGDYNEFKKDYKKIQREINAKS